MTRRGTSMIATGEPPGQDKMERYTGGKDETYSESDDDGSNHVTDIANGQPGHDDSDFDFDPDAGLDNLIIASVESEHIVDETAPNLEANVPCFHAERRIVYVILKGDPRTRLGQNLGAREAVYRQEACKAERAGDTSDLNGGGPCRRQKASFQDAALAIIHDRFSGHGKANKRKKRRRSRGRLPQGRKKYGRFRELRELSSKELLESSSRNVAIA